MFKQLSSKKYILFFVLIILPLFSFYEENEDPYIWLENVHGEKALEWAKSLSDKTIGVLSSHSDYQTMYEGNLSIYDSDERIAYPSILGEYVYNFWQDKTHERGIWRRASLSSYLDGKPNWETLLDMDEMSKRDNIKWVFKGYSGLYPNYDTFIVSLSNGGGDAVIKKEFNIKTKSFDGSRFDLSESKGGTSWIDENNLLISRDFGEGSLTDSGYPNRVKVYDLNKSLEESKQVFEGKNTDVGSWGYTIHSKDKTYQIIARRITFFTGEYYFIEKGKLIPSKFPLDARLSTIFKGQCIVRLKSDWEVNGKAYHQGSIVSIPYQEIIEGDFNVTVIYQPDERSSVRSIGSTKNRLIFNLLSNVKSKLVGYTLVDSQWVQSNIQAPDFGTISLRSTDENSDRFFFSYTNFLTPSTLYYADANAGTSSSIQSLPAFFDAQQYEVRQYEVASKDGTMIPYFVVAAKNVQYDGTNPTLISAYGGFEIAKLPYYSGTIGTCWLDKGGVFVLANLRGGGEFGPKWHQAGLKENRQRIYDDLFAVSQDLIDKKITSPRHLGVEGRSNGGLLVGVAFTQRPDLYNAIVCGVPLLDMKRYNKLLAGASWMGEYGNPDIPAEWAFIKKYSPYQNVSKEKTYPKVFFYTSTKDDRVHPGHARKMAAKMSDMGHDIFYYENIEGGHAGTSTSKQKAKIWALIFSYLHMQLK